MIAALSVELVAALTASTFAVLAMRESRAARNTAQDAAERAEGSHERLDALGVARRPRDAEKHIQQLRDQLRGGKP